MTSAGVLSSCPLYCTVRKRGVLRPVVRVCLHGGFQSDIDINLLLQNDSQNNYDSYNYQLSFKPEEGRWTPSAGLYGFLVNG